MAGGYAQLRSRLQTSLGNTSGQVADVARGESHSTPWPNQRRGRRANRHTWGAAHRRSATTTDAVARRPSRRTLNSRPVCSPGSHKARPTVLRRCRRRPSSHRHPPRSRRSLAGSLRPLLPRPPRRRPRRGREPGRGEVLRSLRLRDLCATLGQRPHELLFLVLADDYSAEPSLRCSSACKRPPAERGAQPTREAISRAVSGPPSRVRNASAFMSTLMVAPYSGTARGRVVRRQGQRCRHRRGSGAG